MTHAIVIAQSAVQLVNTGSCAIVGDNEKQRDARMRAALAVHSKGIDAGRNRMVRAQKSKLNVVTHDGSEGCRSRARARTIPGPVDTTGWHRRGMETCRFGQRKSRRTARKTGHTYRVATSALPVSGLSRQARRPSGAQSLPGFDTCCSGAGFRYLHSRVHVCHATRGAVALEARCLDAPGFQHAPCRGGVEKHR